MTEPLKAKIVFDESQQPLSDQQPDLTVKMNFEQQSEFLPDTVESAEVESEQTLGQILAAKPKRRYRWFKGPIKLLAFFFTVSGNKLNSLSMVAMR